MCLFNLSFFFPRGSCAQRRDAAFFGGSSRRHCIEPVDDRLLSSPEAAFSKSALGCFREWRFLKLSCLKRPDQERPGVGGCATLSSARSPRKYAAHQYSSTRWNNKRRRETWKARPFFAHGTVPSAAHLIVRACTLPKPSICFLWCGSLRRPPPLRVCCWVSLAHSVFSFIGVYVVFLDFFTTIYTSFSSISRSFFFFSFSPSLAS